jgi:Tol biopolymer transport system component
MGPAAAVFGLDGSIVFVSDRNGAKNVWIANADGTKRMRAKAGRIGFASPIWSAEVSTYLRFALVSSGCITGGGVVCR